jgi:hypothetical protein
MMSRKIIAICGIIFCLGALSGYVIFRANTFEESYLSYLSKRHAKLGTAFNNFAATNELTNENITIFLNKLTEENDDLSMVGIKNQDGRIIRVSANSSILSNGKVYEELSDLVCSGKLSPQNVTTNLSQYTEGKKYYAVTKAEKNGSVIAIYPRMLPPVMIAKMSAEGFSVLAGSMILYGLLLALITWTRKKKAFIGAELERRSKEKAEIQKKNQLAETRLHTSLHDTVIEVDAISVTLIIFSTGSKTARQIGWNQGRFFNAKIPNIHSIETNEEMLREIGKGAYIIRDRGKRIIVPVVSGEALIAVFAVTLPKKAGGTQIAQIKKRGKQLANIID